MDIFASIVGALTDAEKQDEGGSYAVLLKKVIGEAYTRRKALTDKGFVFACTECGCTDMETESWVPLNGDVVIDGLGTVAVLSDSSEGTIFCQQCQEHYKGCCEIEVATGVCKYHGEKCVVPHPYEESQSVRSGLLGGKDGQ